MSKTLPDFKLHSMVMTSPHCLKVLTISFFFLSKIGFEIPREIPRPSSQNKPMLRIKEPTISQISAPS